MAIHDADNLGKIGEEWADLFLQACGFTRVTTRYRRPGGEIDLVMRKGDLLVFVEVKTRGVGHYGLPEEAVHQRQLGRLRRLARRFLLENPCWRSMTYRFDVVAVEFEGEGGECRLRHYTGVG